MIYKSATASTEHFCERLLAIPEGELATFLFSVAAEHESKLRRIYEKAASGQARDRFFYIFISESDRAKHINLEKVVYTNNALLTFDSEIRGIVDQFQSDDSQSYENEIRKVFRGFFYNSTDRFQISERTYRALFNGNGSPMYSSWAHDDELIFVGDGTRSDHYVSVDLWFTNEHDARFLTNSYVDRIIEMQEKLGFDGICLLEKYAGPKGVKLRKGIAEALVASGNSTFVFSERMRRILPVPGSKLPSKNAKICLVSEVSYSGSSLKRVKELFADSQYQWNVESALVLLYPPSEVCSSLPLDLSAVVENPLFQNDNLYHNRGEPIGLGLLYTPEELNRQSHHESGGGPYEVLTTGEERDFLRRRSAAISWFEKRSEELFKKHGRMWIGIDSGENPEPIIAGTKEEVREIALADDVDLAYITRLVDRTEIEVR